MAIPVPTLSTQGFVVELSSKIDFLIAYFISTDRAQSNTYSGAVVSLQSIIEAYSGDPLNTAAEITNAIQNYLGRYYQAVNAQCSVTLDDPDNSLSLIKITLSLNFTEDGVIYTANKLLTFYNGKLKEIIEVNNG